MFVFEAKTNSYAIVFMEYATYFEATNLTGLGPML
jgi:hypothetical protein